MAEIKTEWINWHLKTIMRDALELNDPELVEKIRKIIDLLVSKDLEAVRVAVPDLKYTDFQLKVYLVIAGLSREERDIKMLRKMISDQVILFGPTMTGLHIYTAILTRSDYDIKRARRAIERNNSFARTQEYLVLHRDIGMKEDLDSARESAEVEVDGFPYYKPASLTIVAGFTGLLEDYIKMEGALNGIDELALRRSIPGNIDLDWIISEAVTFARAAYAVAGIADEYVRAKVWVLIGISIRKTFTTVVIV